MRNSTWLFALVLTSAALTPAIGQQAEEQNALNSLLAAIFGPRWSLFASGGSSTYGNFLLQSAPGGERVLKGERTSNFGLGAGVDLLPRVGFRLSYTYSSTDLEYRDDIGNGSEALDLDDLGKLKSHMATIEIIRYMLPSRVFLTPYASAGLVGTWWNLDQPSALLEPAGGATQFRFGGTASFGLQVRLGYGLFTRLEATTSSNGNPFTGNHSYRALSGVTIDEPSKVGKKDYRIAVVYFFGAPLVEKKD